MSAEIGDPKCGECGKTREGSDGSYHPIQVILGQPLGWYSGDDGEFCGPCMGDLVRLANQGGKR